MAENPSNTTTTGTPSTTSPAEMLKVRTLEYAATRTFWDRLRDHLPTGEQLLGLLKNMLWVAPLTLLIWIYAEREQSVSVSGMIFPIEIKTTAPDRIVAMRWPADHNVVAELSGPRAKIDEIRQLLLPRSDGAAVQLLIDPQLGTGPQELWSINQLNNYPLFKNNGITVKSVQPPYIKVDIDQIEERDAVVEVPPDVAGLLDSATFTPRVVRVRAPSRMFETAKKDKEGQNFVVWADLSKRPEVRTRTGNVELKNVPLYWSYRDNVVLSTAAADATLIVKAAAAQHTIKSMPINKETPAGLEDRYKVVYADTIANVTLVGPAEQIEQIKSGAFQVKARIEVPFITAGDTARAALKFELPPGVKLDADTAHRAGEWEVRLVER